MKKKNTKYVRIQEPVPAPTGYPFINPIILTKDMKIFDGQHRYEVCKDMGRGVECIVVDFNADELSNPDCMARIRDIQQKQTARMESYFKKYDIGYNKRFLLNTTVLSLNNFKYYAASINYITKSILPIHEVKKLNFIV